MGVVRNPCSAMASSSVLLSVTHACSTPYAHDCYRPYRDRVPVAARTQMPTLMRVKRFRVTPASSRTFWTDFLLSSAYG